MGTRIEKFSQFYENNSSIVAAALFGSRARGDHDEASDTDILLVTPDAKPKHISEGNCSLSFYSQDHLIEKARSGDLFVCHIVYEAKPLRDQNGFFDCLKGQFHFRKSYKEEVEHASDLGWFLIKHSEVFDNYKIINKRIAWCVRTILIARAAEKKKPIFAASQLADSVAYSSVKQLIANKDTDNFNNDLNEKFVGFLAHYGIDDSTLGNAKSVRDFLRKFRATDNKVALNTFRALLTEEHMLSYE